MLTFFGEMYAKIHRSEKKSALSSAATDAARRTPYDEVFINLMTLIKSEVSFFVNKELMRVSVVRGWVLMRHLLTLLHFLEIPICCSCKSTAFIFVAFFYTLHCQYLSY